MLEYYQLERGRYSDNYFDYIVHIGTKQGSLIGGFVNIYNGVQIIGYEPNIFNFQQLAIKTKDVHSVRIINQALGDGSYLFLKEAEKENMSMFIKDETSLYKIKSNTLSEIFSDNDIDLNKKIAVVISCSGGERFLLQDIKNVDIIQSCEHFAMSTHFQPKSDVNRYLIDLPEWEEYNDWVYNNFDNTHEVIYERSRRKAGRGFYILKKRT